jgi:hypothetical protein
MLASTTRFALVLVSLVAGCGALLFMGSETQARVPAGPRVDSLSAGCGALQDRADALRAEYARLGKNMTQADHDRIIGELREIGNAWNGTCSRIFGSAIYMTRPTLGVGGLTTGGIGPTLVKETAPATSGKGKLAIAPKAQRSVLMSRK